MSFGWEVYGDNGAVLADSSHYSIVVQDLVVPASGELTMAVPAGFCFVGVRGKDVVNKGFHFYVTNTTLHVALTGGGVVGLCVESRVVGRSGNYGVEVLDEGGNRVFSSSNRYLKYISSTDFRAWGASIPLNHNLFYTTTNQDVYVIGQFPIGAGHMGVHCGVSMLTGDGGVIGSGRKFLYYGVPDDMYDLPNPTLYFTLHAFKILGE